MARHYRTPELVAYHKGGDKPPPSSDVFQLGLVAAELFTGKNLLLPDSPDKPLRLQPLADIPGFLGAPIKSLLEQMLILDSMQRPSASNLLRKWQELFLRHCKREHDERRIDSTKKSAPEAPSAAPVGDKPLEPPTYEFGAEI